jgi:hypothetical protein
MTKCKECQIELNTSNAITSSYKKDDGSYSFKQPCRACNNTHRRSLPKQPPTKESRLCHNAYVRLWRRDNPEKVASYKEKLPANYHKIKSKEWYYLHRDQELARSAQYQKDNRQLCNFWHHKSRLKYCTPKWVDMEAIKQFFLDCPDEMTVDHIIPTGSKAVSGLHVLANLQYLTSFQNQSKGVKY